METNGRWVAISGLRAATCLAAWLTWQWLRMRVGRRAAAVPGR